MAYGGTAAALSAVDRAHQQLLQQTDLQFNLAPMVQPPTPSWVQALIAFFKFLGPATPYVVWPALILGAGTILYLIGRELFGIRRGGVRMKLRLAADDGLWRPAPDQARALLEDADRLAAEGQFVEAAHLILLRSIEDIEKRRPRTVGVALTSRDIAALPQLPPGARETFAGIAQVVERSLFGGRPLDRDGFVRCRDAYAAFVDAKSWATS
jgi:hypothetical protein